MIARKLRIVVLLSAFLVSTACAVTSIGRVSPDQGQKLSPTFELVRSYYAIDRHLPLDAQVLASDQLEKTIKQQIRFRAYDREWVTGTLAIPGGVEHPPIVILLHGITQSKAQWWSPGGDYSFPSLHRQALIDGGIAVLAIDARNHGDRIEEKDFENAYAYLQHGYYEAGKKMIAESAIDVVRAIDYLETREDIDATSLGIAGFSLGAHIAWIATAVDNRIDRSLIMAMPALANAEGQTESFTNPGLYLPGLLDRNVMVIAAKEDVFYSEEQMNGIYERIPSSKKKIVWVEGGHDLPDSTGARSHSFFVEQLKEDSEGD